MLFNKVNGRTEKVIVDGKPATEKIELKSFLEADITTKVKPYPIGNRERKAVSALVVNKSGKAGYVESCDVLSNLPTSSSVGIYFLKDNTCKELYNDRGSTSGVKNPILIDDDMYLFNGNLRKTNLETEVVTTILSSYNTGCHAGWIFSFKKELYCVTNDNRIVKIDTNEKKITFICDVDKPGWQYYWQFSTYEDEDETYIFCTQDVIAFNGKSTRRISGLISSEINGVFKTPFIGEDGKPHCFLWDWTGAYTKEYIFEKGIFTLVNDRIPQEVRATQRFGNEIYTFNQYLDARFKVKKSYKSI